MQEKDHLPYTTEPTIVRVKCPRLEADQLRRQYPRITYAYTLADISALRSARTAAYHITLHIPYRFDTRTDYRTHTIYITKIPLL